MLTNVVTILGLMALILVVVYVILPKMKIGNYGSQILKIAIAWCAIGYVAFDKYKQGNLTVSVVLVLGALVFAFVALNAKEKK
jgi:hypothetical protein